MYEETERKVKENIIGERKTVVEGIPISYKIYKPLESYEHRNAEWCWVDSNGNIYVCELRGVREELREKFRDLIAYHEKLEFEWLKSQGLPAPKWKINSEDEIEIAEEIHYKAHYYELIAAKNMGILEEYLRWRPKEPVTDKFLRQIKSKEDGKGKG